MRSTEVLGPVCETGGRVRGALPRRRRYERRDAGRPDRRPATAGPRRCARPPGWCRGVSARRWTCGGSGCRATTATRAGLNGSVRRPDTACAIIDRGDYYQIAYLIRKGTDCADARRGHRVDCDVGPSPPWCRGWRTGRRADIASTTSNCSTCSSIGCAAGTPTGCCSSATRRTRCRRSAASASTWPSPTRWRPPASWPPRCADGAVTTSDLARVQARRWLPAALIQRVQRIVHDRCHGAVGDRPRPAARGPRRPRCAVVRIARASPALRAVARVRHRHRPAARARPDYARR